MSKSEQQPQSKKALLELLSRVPPEWCPFFKKYGNIFGIFGFFLALVVTIMFWFGMFKPFAATGVLLIWSVVPPLWFFFEYFATPQGKRKSVKASQEVARPIWAGIIAALVLVHPNGPLV